MKLMEIAKEVIKRQFDKKKRNPQGLKAGDNVWLKAKNIHSNRSSKKLNLKNMDPLEFQRTLVKEHFS